MQNENNLSKLLNQFDLSANRFCEETNGMYCDIRSEYKGNAAARRLQSRTAMILYPSFAVEFRYTAHGAASLVNSILECYIYPDKSDRISGIYLQFLISYYGIETIAPLAIPLITNETGMEQAFICIGGVLKDMLERVYETVSDPAKKNELLSAFQAEVNELFNISTTSETAESNTGDSSDMANESFVPEESRFFHTFITLRYTSAPFINLLAGKTDKAIKQLEKIKNPTGYERHILSLLKSGTRGHIYDLSAIGKNAAHYNNSGVPKTNFKEFKSYFLSIFIIIIPVSAVLLAIYFLLYFLEGIGSAYLMGPLYNFPFCFVGGFIVSLSLAYFPRHKVYKRLYPEDYERYLEMDVAQNGPGADKLIRGFAYVLVIASLVMIVLFTKWNVNFREDGFVDNSEFLSVRGTFHSYDDIEYLYYKPDRVNDFGDTFDRPSYVMRLKNGTEIDFIDFADISWYETTLLDYLRDIGIKIK